MKITRTGPMATTSVRRTSRRNDGGSGNFADALPSEDGPEVAPRSGVSGTPAIGSLLSAQEVDDPAGRPARARQRAEDLLDRLDEIRHGLLAGTLSRRDVDRLARQVRSQRAQVTDPRLIEILDQIELRAEIELAKYSTLG